MPTVTHGWVLTKGQAKPSLVLILSKFSTQDKFKMSYENFNFDYSEIVGICFQYQISSSCFCKCMKSGYEVEPDLGFQLSKNFIKDQKALKSAPLIRMSTRLL